MGNKKSREAGPSDPYTASPQVITPAYDVGPPVAGGYGEDASKPKPKPKPNSNKPSVFAVLRGQRYYHPGELLVLRDQDLYTCCNASCYGDLDLFNRGCTPVV